MAIKYNDKTIGEVFKELEDEKLVLPNFQRSFVWDSNKQKALLASLLVKLPVGSLLTLEGDSDSFQKRRICRQANMKSNRGEHLFLLDGQQRLSTLRAGLHDLFSGDDWTQILDDSFSKIRNRWFLDIEGDKEDHFGLKNLKFKGLEHLIDLDLIDYIELKRIFKTKPSELHHPAYLKDAAREELSSKTNNLINNFTQDKLVPLYELDLKRQGLHRKVLERVARRQAEIIREEINNSSYDRDIINRYFSQDDTEAHALFDEFRINPESKDVRDRLNYMWVRMEHQWAGDVSDFIESLLELKIPFIELDKTETGRAVAIFEAVNKGGVPLSVYDLIVAKSAHSNEFENLSLQIAHELDNSISISRALSESFNRYCHHLKEPNDWTSASMGTVDDNAPSKDIKDWFVNLLSLLVNKYEFNESPKIDHIKREKILSLTSANIGSYWKSAIKGIIRALAFLQMRCGVIKSKNISYKHMVLVLAYILEDDESWENSNTFNILEYWYWSSLFSGRYMARQNERCGKDLVMVQDCVTAGSTAGLKQRIAQEDLFNVKGYVTFDMLLRKNPENDDFEPSAIRDGILQFIMSRCPVDYLKAETDQKIQANEDRTISAWKVAREELISEAHHILPLATSKKIDESTKILRSNKAHFLNSIANITFTSKASNNWIGTRAPSEYFKKIDEAALNDHFMPNFSTHSNQDETSQEYFIRERLTNIKRGVLDRLSKLEV